jgi:hypothetical protein
VDGRTESRKNLARDFNGIAWVCCLLLALIATGWVDARMYPGEPLALILPLGLGTFVAALLLAPTRAGRYTAATGLLLPPVAYGALMVARYLRGLGPAPRLVRPPLLSES